MPYLSNAAEKCTDGDDGCTPPWVKKGSATDGKRTTVSTLIALLPFIVSFVICLAFAFQRLFPFLCGSRPLTSKASNSRALPRRSFIPQLVCATTLALSFVLAELILCQISGWVDPHARAEAFRTVINGLLVLLVLVCPALQIHAFIEALGFYRSRGTGKTRIGIALFLAILGSWLWVFWGVGGYLPGADSTGGTEASQKTLAKSLSEQVLARTSVIGISLMAVLSGFACINNPYRVFVSSALKPKFVSDTAIARAQQGLHTTQELIESKSSRMALLENKLIEKATASGSAGSGFMSRMMSSIRGGDSDTQELAALRMEISSLETMYASLASDLATMLAQKTEQERSRTAFGRCLISANYMFALYCIYRFASTLLSRLPYNYLWNRSASDPISNLLAIIAKHWDPSLDRASWARMIGFLLSGVIILASISSVYTTFTYLASLSRPIRSLFETAPASSSGTKASPNGASFALLVAQITGTYLISSAVLLRSNLPEEMRNPLTVSLGAVQLQHQEWVQSWFDGLFLMAACSTAVVLFIGRKITGGNDEGWEERELEEGGKGK